MFCILMLIFPLTLFAAGQKEEKEAKAVKHGKFTIILHKVHRDVSTEGAGGDITKDWLEAHSEVEGIEWLTLSSDWPMIDVEYDGHTVQREDILVL